MLAEGKREANRLDVDAPQSFRNLAAVGHRIAFEPVLNDIDGAVDVCPSVWVKQQQQGEPVYGVVASLDLVH